MFRSISRAIKKLAGTNILQSVFALATKILAAGSVLILNAVITRVLSLDEAGSYLTLNAFILFWVMASANGIPQILMRWAASRRAAGNYEHVERNLLQGALILLAIGGVTACGVLLFWHDRILGGKSNLALAVVAWICLGLVLRLFGEVYRGLGSAGIANLVTAVNSHGIIVTLVVAGILALVHLKAGVDMKIIANTYVGVLLVAVAIMGWMLVSDIRSARKRHSRVSVAAHVEETLFSIGMLKKGLMLSLAELSVYVMTQGDIWIVGKYASPSEVALYGVASKTAYLTSLFLIAINSVLPARMAVFIHEGKTDLMQQEIRRLVRFALIAALGWLVLCAVIGGPLLGLAFGKAYTAAKYFLVILSLGHVINVATGPCGLLLIMYHRERELIGGTLLVLAIYLACVFPVGHSFGAIGVACCSAAGYALVNLVYACLVKRSTGIDSGILRF